MPLPIPGLLQRPFPTPLDGGPSPVTCRRHETAWKGRKLGGMASVPLPPPPPCLGTGYNWVLAQYSPTQESSQRVNPQDFTHPSNCLRPWLLPKRNTIANVPEFTAGPDGSSVTKVTL